MDRFLEVSKKWLPIFLYVVMGGIYWHSLKPETKEVTGSLVIAAFVFWEFWGKKNKRYQYVCIIKKKILIPENFLKNRPFLHSIRFYKRISLPFTPQIGMSLSEEYELHKSKRMPEWKFPSVHFRSGVISSIHWDGEVAGGSEPGKFWCEVASDNVTENCDFIVLRMKILDCLLAGWKPEDCASEEIIREQIGLLLREKNCSIDKSEKDKSWTPDKIEREREQVNREAYILEKYSGIKIDLHGQQSA